LYNHGTALSKDLQFLADLKYPEISVEYQPPTINVSDISVIPSQLLKINYPIIFRGEKEYS
jgi:hypothetical protein